MSLLAHANRHFTNIAKYKDLNAIVSLADRSSILSAASNADQHAPNNPLNPRGRIVLVKDNICTTELPTTASSGILKQFKSPYDATVVKQLKDAGALIAGKTNMDEFGMGSHNINSYHGATKMKRGRGEEERSAGGSSGGSAVAAATDMCWAALGTDTGGSVRLPAAYTGVVGFKPSYGLLSRWGIIAYANSLDTVGVLGGDVDAVEGVFDTLNHHDPLDPTSLAPTTRARLPSLTTSAPLRIGIPIDYNIPTLSSSVLKTWKYTLRALHNQGHTLHPIHLPYTRHALSAYYVLAPAEASSNLAKYDGVRYGSRAEGIDGKPESVLFAKTRGQGLGEEVRRRILLGAFSLSAEAIDNYFIQAQRVRRLVQQDFDQAFRAVNPLLSTKIGEENGEGVDVLVCPTAPTLAPLLKDVQCQDPLKAYMNDVFTVPASLAGLPAINVPVGVAEGEDVKETVGMQIIGQYGSDKLVLDVARKLFGGGGEMKG